MRLTLNHNKEFKNYENGCCTNTIEGIWNGVKLSITPKQSTAKGTLVGKTKMGLALNQDGIGGSAKLLSKGIGKPCPAA